MRGNVKQVMRGLTAAGAAACLLVSTALTTVWGEEAEVVDGSAMGRYVETKLELPEGLVPSAMTVLEDGTLRILGIAYGEEASQAGLWDSGDKGDTWELAAALPDEYGNAYFSAAALAADGSGAAVNFEENGESGNVMECTFLSIDAQGNVQATSLGDLESNSSKIPSQLKFSGSGVLGGVCYGGGAALLDPATGAMTAQLSESGGTVLSGGQNEFLLLTYDSQLLRYNASTGEPLERDEALEENLFANGASYEILTSSGYPIVMTEDSEGRLYYCTSQGIFAHTMGGGAVEQVVDGDLTTLSDPSITLQSLAVADQSFYVMYMDENGYTSLARYDYDPDIPATPERELTIYSLEENDGLRQAITQFQNQHPDTYVNYQIGMSGQEGVTASDALRTLNTEILSGNGPDILIMDGINLENYEEQGLLMDLTDLLQSTADTEGLLENIAWAYRREGGTYAVPTRFSIPVIVGEKELVDSVGSLNDLASIAGTQGNLMPWSALSLTETLYPACAGSWKNGDGTINQEKLAEFVNAVKQTYDAYTGSATQEELDRLAALREMGVSLTGVDDVNAAALNMLDGSCRVFVGSLYDMMGYSSVTSVNRITENTVLAGLIGQQSGVFTPSSIVSVLNTAREQERALEFVTYLLSAEGGTAIQQGGFPVNAQAFETLLTTPSFEDGSFSSVSSNNETGEMVELVYYWPTQEEQNTLRELVNGLTTCADTDRVTKDAVLENMNRCLTGEIGTDEAVNAIMQTVNLYLAE